MKEISFGYFYSSADLQHQFVFNVNTSGLNQFFSCGFLYFNQYNIQIFFKMENL